MFQLTPNPIDSAALRAALERDDAGALVVFEGRVRNENQGRPVERLDYEAEPTLAVAEGEAILQEAREKFSLLDVRCVHRTGSLGLGEVAVWVGVLAAHRGAAFDGCRYVIEQLKVRVPIWKKEHYASGEATWINAE
ncbi:MAG TPA: molybdenum cofactor biosynthesis protein MoaE [Kiritimatiellia bacterium]|jgi:molybdopterin synthase catalytic subunit